MIPIRQLAQANVVSQIPEIQTREIESLLRVRSGDIAVMGGLMQDVINKSSRTKFRSSAAFRGSAICSSTRTTRIPRANWSFSCVLS